MSRQRKPVKPPPGGAHETFGAALRILRTEAGVGLRALASDVGVSSAYLSRVENGRDPAPTPERLAAIAEALDVPASALVELAGRTSAALTTYFDRVPAAGQLFLEIARRDLDAEAIGRLADIVRTEFPDPDAPPVSGPSLPDLISLARIRLKVACRTIEDIIDVGAVLCALRFPDASAGDIGELLRAREADCSTALGHGIAVPHAHIDGAEPRAALVTPAKPVKADTPDGEPIRAAIVLVSGSREQHATTLALVARLSAQGAAQQLYRVRSRRHARTILGCY